MNEYLALPLVFVLVITGLLFAIYWLAWDEDRKKVHPCHRCGRLCLAEICEPCCNKLCGGEHYYRYDEKRRTWACKHCGVVPVHVDGDLSRF